ncbi:hypothetical protein [Desulfocurvus sp. DL9XJH121]
MALEVNVGSQRVSVDLEALKNTSGTLYLQGGEIKESKFSLGRSILGFFSSSIRQQNRGALQALTMAMRQSFGAVPSTVQNLDKISGSDIPRMANRARMEGFMGRVQAEYGCFAQGTLGEIRGMQDWELNRILDSDGRTESKISSLEHGVERQETQGLGNLGKIMRNADLSPREVLTGMRDIPRFATLYDGGFGLGRDFTVGRHTEQVLTQYEDQKSHYDLDGMTARLQGKPGFEDFNADRFMKTVLAFHDIGKSLCHGDNARQHEFTVPIMKEAMQKMGYSEQQVRLALNLVNNDLLGEWQQGKTHDVKQVLSGIRGLAQDSGVPPRDLLAMQKLFYISDASSYQPLREAFMEADSSGKLHFSDNRTDDVLASFAREHGALGQKIGTALLAPDALAGKELYPVKLFSQDLSGTGTNVYDLSRTILENKDRLREQIAKLEPAEFREVAAKRLDQALEMATTALKMDADHWTAEHTQGVIVARLDIRRAGISDVLPRTLGAQTHEKAYFGELEGMDGLRGKDSVSDKFYELVDARGGSSALLQVTGQCQVFSSWCPTSMAVKGYLARSRAVSEDHYFQAKSDQHGPVTIKSGECYEKFAHAPRGYWQGLNSGITGGDMGAYIDQVSTTTDRTREDIAGQPATDTSMFDTSIRYQVAMQMEMLANFDFPGNDPENGVIRLYRVEGQGVLAMYGIENPGDKGVMTRGASDSSSILSPVMGAGGQDATVTTVPHHRVFNSFFLGAQHSSVSDSHAQTSVLMGNMQREVLFMSDGLETEFLGDGQDLCREFMRQPGVVGNITATTTQP